MKKALLLILFLAITTNLFAQQSLTRKIFLKQRYNKQTGEILQKQMTRPASNKGTSVTDRLIGWSTYFNGSISDTAHYKYNTNTRTSNLNNLLLQTYTDDGFDPVGTTLYPYPYSPGRNSPSLMYDTGYYYSDLGGGAYYETSSYRLYTASTFTQVEKLNYNFGSGTLAQRSKGEYSYNAAGNITLAKTYYDTTSTQNGPFMPDAISHFIYSGNRPVQDSTEQASVGSPTPISNVLYSYDGQGNIVTALTQSWNGAMWKDYSRDLYTYTAANQLTIGLYQEITPSLVWVSKNVDTFRYTGSNLTYNSHYDRNTSNGLWENGTVATNTYNSFGSLDSGFYGEVDATGLVPRQKGKYTYTSFQHLDTISIYYHNGSIYSIEPDAVFRFFYENITTGINNIAASNRTDISLYPIPAKDVVHIRFNGQQKGNATVRIYNAIGQMMQSTTLSGTNYAVPVSSLPAGSYFAEVSDDNGSGRLQFVKY